ncbi:MAG: CBS domain-containing protein [Coriobacteriales bacterium]|jgi:Mg2+ transporter MgtE|nr:CBS domain-containing protein [Coriobacteriales bacterium]
MPYLSQILSRPVIDADGVEIGRINDLAIQTGEVFPRITSVAFRGPSKTPFMVSWRKYVSEYDGSRVVLNTASHNIRFSYLQPDELLLARDLMNKQIVDTQGLKVVRVNDLKISQSGKQLRLLGAEVGMLGILRSLAPWFEKLVSGVSRLLRHPLEENIIAWNYMELVDRDLSSLQLSMTHKRLHELHPADVADILEQLDPQQRSKVFEHLDAQHAAETMSELDEEYQTDLIDDMSESDASELLASMDPDDAADIIGDLPYEKAEKLLWLMGVQDSRRIRSLLGYKEKTAGGIMTPEFVSVLEDMTVAQTVEKLRALQEDSPAANYIYTVDAQGILLGALSMRSLVLADPQTKVYELAERDLITAEPDEDQEEVADIISKYGFLALPIVDENKKLLGIVTVDDALEVLEEEHDEDLQIAGASSGSRDDEDGSIGVLLRWFLRRMMWFVIWAVLALMIVMAGGLEAFIGALALAPIVLLMADNSVSFAVSDLLNYGSSSSSARLGKLLRRNLVLTLAVALLGSILALALGSALDANLLNANASGLTPGFPASLQVVTLQLVIEIKKACLPVVITICLVTLSSIFVLIYGRGRLDKDKELSNTAITFIVMLCALAVQFGLTYLVQFLNVM